MRVICGSPWIPVEWIKAHGFEPRGIWSLPENGDGELPLAAGVCAVAEAAVCCAEKFPADALILSTACDQMRRACDAVTIGRERVFLFNLPATWQSATARELFRSEVERLGRFLESLGGRSPSNADLTATMRRYSQSRIQLLEAAQQCSARQFAEGAARLYEDGLLATPCSPPEPVSEALPLALIGSLLPSTHFGLLDAIEAAHGRVVLNATEPGERTLGPVFRNDAGATDPKAVLTRDYFENITDVFQRPNSRLYDWLRPRLRDRQVCGIVLWHFIGCDLWRAEAQSLREAFALPVLPLDADELQTHSARVTGRLQAFLETLR